MALISCHECSKEISDMAVSCPHCGAQVMGVTVAENGIRRTETEIDKSGRIGSVFAVLLGTVFAVYDFRRGGWFIGILSVGLFFIVALALSLPKQIGKCPYCGHERSHPAIRRNDIDTTSCRNCHKAIKVYRDYFESIPNEQETQSTKNNS